MKSPIPILVACAACLVVAGCGPTTAEMLARPGGANAPTSGPDFGLIRYIADGSSSNVEAQQANANSQMSAACNGHYRIVDQGTRDEVNLQQGGRFGRQVWATNTNYVYIKFVCTQ